MFDFKQGWLITKRELQSNGVMFIWSTIMMVYMGVIVGFLYYTNQNEILNYGLLDILMLVTAPLLSIDYSRRSFRLMKEDTYRKQMIYFRSLPIPFSAVLGSRLQVMGIMLLYNSILFFGLIYFVGARTIPGMSITAYLTYAISWISLGLILTSLYVYMEYAVRQQTYLFWSIVSTVLLLGLAILGIVINRHASSMVMKAAIDYQLASPIMWIGLALAAITLIIAFRVIYRKARVRDLV